MEHPLSRTKHSLAAVASVLIAAACGSPSAPSTPSSTASIQSVTITVDVSSLTAVGQTSQATARATFSNGGTQDVTATCTGWQSDNAGVLTVNSTGLLTAQGSGAATITAACQGLSARALLTVTLKPTTFTLSGTVTDGHSGGILPNIAVQIVDGPNAGKSTRTDAVGLYSINGLSAGTFTVSISAISYITTTRSVDMAGDTRLNVVLQRMLPANGTYNYTLDVHSPTSCLTQSVETAGSFFCIHGPDWVTSDFILNGQLVVQDDGLTLRFVGDFWDGVIGMGTPNPTFQFQRTATQLTNGTIRFSAGISGVFSPGISGMRTAGGDYVTSVALWSDAFSGQTDNNGRFAGVFDGRVAIVHPGMPCDRTWVCTTSGFAWTLTPR